MVACQLRHREQLAWPGIAAAAARAALGRSRYLDARDQLAARGLIAVESAGRRRGQSTTLTVPHAQSGPWWDGEVNAGLLEHVLSHSQTRGPARLLLATLAALADESGSVDELCTDELCRAAGLANSTYRRARTALLATGEIELVDHGGGRSRMNRWRVLAVAGGLTTSSARPQRRRAPAPSQLPLLSPARTERRASCDSAERIGMDHTVLLRSYRWAFASPSNETAGTIEYQQPISLSSGGSSREPGGGRGT